jgi:tRNA-2-methylthio-N6-dimethylallyladenosine synthase
MAATPARPSCPARTWTRTSAAAARVHGRGVPDEARDHRRVLAERRSGYPFRAVKRYFVTTFGCQMNAHDSERIKGLLEELGLGEAPSPDEADVVVFNTCTIREKPDQKLAAHLGQAAARKREDPSRVVAVGGCYAEAQRDRIFERYPFVDVAFGPGSIAHLGDWLGAGGVGVARGRFGLDDRAFAAELPGHRERSFQAWVQVSMGCNSTCSYCIVPSVRGREQSRRPGEILAEVEQLAEQGVRELTLLGQNVNSWGRDLLPGVRTEFGELLRACDAVDGIERIRFTSPHPKDFRDPVIAAMAECAAVCEQVHLPLQSGSSRILKLMRRTYTRERYVALVERMRDAIPDVAIGTDVIVGFPGETEDDFRQTLEVVEEVGYDSAFTFVYSPRAGTDAATMPEQVPHEVKIERMERLVELTQGIARSRNEARVGRVEEVLVEGRSRTDESLLRGRTRRNTTVNFEGTAQPGELVPVLVDAATSTTLRGTQQALVAV